MEKIRTDRWCVQSWVGGRRKNMFSTSHHGCTSFPLVGSNLVLFSSCDLEQSLHSDLETC